MKQLKRRKLTKRGVERKARTVRRKTAHERLLARIPQAPARYGTTFTLSGPNGVTMTVAPDPDCILVARLHGVLNEMRDLVPHVQRGLDREIASMRHG